MKILNTINYLDGGSQIVFTDEGTWCIDRRIGTETRIDYIPLILTMGEY